LSARGVRGGSRKPSRTTASTDHPQPVQLPPLAPERTRPAASPTADPIDRLQAINLPSAEQAVYEALRGEIIKGLPPGTALRLNELAVRFAVSTMPVRAALARLQAEGLVVQRPRRGSVVAALSAEDFLDLYAIRMAIEGVAARYGVPHLTGQDITTMWQHLDRLRALDADNPDIADQYLQLDQSLHDICYNVCGRPQLIGLIGVYRRQAERYFRLYLDQQSSLPAEIELQQNWVSACEQKSPDAAEAATRALFDRTCQVLLPTLF
jgi:DNA-binding GntR family transcriptional regulator